MSLTPLMDAMNERAREHPDLFAPGAVIRFSRVHDPDAAPMWPIRFPWKLTGRAATRVRWRRRGRGR